VSGLSDEAILALAARHGKAEEIVIGLDAPLSYAFGGGDRPADRSLRRAVAAVGMKTASVMAPTAQRMSYVTMRGIALTRALERSVCAKALRIVEVHPGAAIGFRYAAPPVPAVVLDYKQPENAAYRGQLAAWMDQSMGLGGVASRLGAAPTSHEVDACAAALAAWKWANGQSAWRWPASGPMHPYEVAC
jgi:predicted nuclease with RNAse H fold